MTTVNTRIMQPQAMTINTIANGGLMTLRLNAGYDNILQTPVDGLELSLIDRLTEFVRGNMTGQDWVHIIELLTGVVGTSVHYQRKSGAEEATGYIKHTITNPVIYKCNLSLQHRGYASAGADFECRAADPTKGIADIWVPLDAQAPPTYISAARGIEITACLHGALAIYHVTRLELNIEMPLIKASQDGDVGYTAVDALLSGIKASGSLTFQDAGITAAQLKAVQLIKAAKAALVLTVKLSQGATAKTLTLANVLFTSLGQDSNADSKDYDTFNLPFIIANDATTQLTLTGTNKIITIA